MNFLFPFFNSLPGAFGQGLAWGVMAIGLYNTYKILELSDLTVDGSFCTGGAVCIHLQLSLRILGLENTGVGNHANIGTQTNQLHIFQHFPIPIRPAEIRLVNDLTAFYI